MNATRIKQLILNLLLALLIIFAPSNLFLVLCDDCGYVNGLQSDYLLPKLYLVDLLMLAIVGWGIWQKVFQFPNLKKWSPTSLATGGVVLLLGLRQLWAPFLLVAVWNFGQLCLLAATGYVLVKAIHQKIVRDIALLTGLLLGLLLQVGVAGFQYINQKPLFSYYVLGETDISKVVGITTQEFSNQVLTAPYGTTAHPNVLAGFLAIYSLMLVKWLIIKKTSFDTTIAITGTVLASLLTLGLTESTSGAAVLVSGGVILSLEQLGFLAQKPAWLRQKVLIFLILMLMIGGLATIYLPNQTNSVHRRQYLLKTSWGMTQHNWLWGSGLSNFTGIAEQYSQTNEVIRFNQPVHHVGWLWLAETGLLGVALLFFMMTQVKDTSKSHILIFSVLLLLPILVWDHYLISLENGRILLLVVSLLLLTKHPNSFSSHS